MAQNHEALMPTTQLLPLELPPDGHHQIGFSRNELREISVALMDQIRTLIHVGAAAYAEHIDHSRIALAKILQCIGQKAGDKCFLCRKPLAVAGETRQVRCPDGCELPADWLRRGGHGQ
jgi:hypothetical protein